jgi:hypothetical protein
MRTWFWWGNVRKLDHLENPGVGGRLILKWVIMTWDWRHGLDCSDSGWEQVAGTCKHGNEHSGCMKCG